MLSLFVMYSNDRAVQWSRTLSRLRIMGGYQDCQKTLVVDGRFAGPNTEFQVVQVPRSEEGFCWANMWAAGVATARFPVVVYLDCDRLLPSNFLQLAANSVRDNLFVFTSRHFLVLKDDLSLEDCSKLLDGQIDGLLSDQRFVGALRFEPRFTEPVHGPGKNVMSGSVGFTKQTFLRLGGVDPWYKGHGAFADTDFHQTAAAGGCRFLDLQVTELHEHHAKLDLSGLPLDEVSLGRLGLDNFIYYCAKWRLPRALSESLACRCHISNPGKYVSQKLTEYGSQITPGNLAKQQVSIG